MESRGLGFLNMGSDSHHNQNTNTFYQPRVICIVLAFLSLMFDNTKDGSPLS